jgi:electron transfer flavoprotein alpha subunit
MPHVIDPKACAICGACEATCPTGAAQECANMQTFEIDPDLCTDCNECLEVCPTEAISCTDTKDAVTPTEEMSASVES